MKRERPPADETGGPQETTATALSEASLPKPAETVAEQLRRRRKASWRLPPLESGYRDPIDNIERRSASIIAVLELEQRWSA